MYGETRIESFTDYEGPTYVGSSNRLGDVIRIALDVDGDYKTIPTSAGPGPGTEGTEHRDHPVSRRYALGRYAHVP